MRIQNFKTSFKIWQGDALLSRVMLKPGPTHEIFDVLAAAMATNTQRVNNSTTEFGSVALLGFAGGGVMAPLRAMGWKGAVRAVDLDLTAYRLFYQHCSSWAGDLEVTQSDALFWMQQQKEKYDLIVEDLSVDQQGHIVKPQLTFDELPALCQKVRSPKGSILVNILPDTVTWKEAYNAYRSTAKAMTVIYFDDYENRFLLLGPGKEANRWRISRMRASLEAIDSEMARGWNARAI